MKIYANMADLDTKSNEIEATAGCPSSHSDDWCRPDLSPMTINLNRIGTKPIINEFIN